MEAYKGSSGKRFAGYWLRAVEWQFLMIIGMVAVLMIYGFLTSSHMSIQDAFEIMPFALIGFGTLMTGAFAIGNANTTINMSISFGSTRKEAFKGLIVSMTIMIVQLLIVYSAASVIIGGMISQYIVDMGIIFAGLLLGAAGVGLLGIGLFRRFGGMATVIYTSIVGAVAGALFFGIVAVKPAMDLFLGFLKIIIPVAGTVVFTTGCLVCYMNIKKMEVKW